MDRSVGVVFVAASASEWEWRSEMATSHAGMNVFMKVPLAGARSHKLVRRRSETWIRPLAHARSYEIETV